MLKCYDFFGSLHHNTIGLGLPQVSNILLKILENEDFYKGLEFIISKVNFYSS